MLLFTDDAFGPISEFIVVIYDGCVIRSLLLLDFMFYLLGTIDLRGQLYKQFVLPIICEFDAIVFDKVGTRVGFVIFSGYFRFYKLIVYD